MDIRHLTQEHPTILKRPPGAQPLVPKLSQRGCSLGLHDPHTLHNKERGWESPASFLTDTASKLSFLQESCPSPSDTAQRVLTKALASLEQCRFYFPLLGNDLGTRSRPSD